MSKPSTTPSNAGRNTKGDRVPVITRFPKALLSKIDARAGVEGLTRQDAIEAGMKRWADGTPRAAPAAEVTAPAPTPRKAPKPAAPAEVTTHANRLDKSQIGKRLAPKPKAGARSRPEPEEVV